MSQIPESIELGETLSAPWINVEERLAVWRNEEIRKLRDHYLKSGLEVSYDELLKEVIENEKEKYDVNKDNSPTAIVLGYILSFFGEE
jgi:hypothetical protein